MNPSATAPSKTTGTDKDLAEQAVAGHGIPSQDPETAAQVLLGPQEAEREAKSVLVGGGMVAGMATGAAIGVAVAGPIGVVVGSALGAVAGAMGGAAVGATANPTDVDGADAVPADTSLLHNEDVGGAGRVVTPLRDAGR